MKIIGKKYDQKGVFKTFTKWSSNKYFNVLIRFPNKKMWINI